MFRLRQWIGFRFYSKSTGQISKEIINSTMLIELDRPHKRNAITQEMATALREAINDFEADSRVHVGIIHGVGGNFCSGYDLKEISEAPSQLASTNIASNRTKPLIAAVEGYAVGSGFELAILCDLIIASDNASFGFLNRRYGIALADGGTVRLPRLIGLSRAMDLILTGRCIDANTAFQWGLLHKVVSVGAALGQAFSIASSLCNFPLDAMKADRQSTLYSALNAVSEEDALNFESRNSVKAFEQGVQGAKRFADEGVGKHGSFKRVNNLL